MAKPDPRKVSANADLLNQVNFAPTPLGKRKSLIVDLQPFKKSWSSPPIPAPGGIRLQIWNMPMVDKDGRLMKVPLGDYLMAYAEGVEEKAALTPRHLAHTAIAEASKEGVLMVEFQHQYFIQTHRGEILDPDQLSILRENELVWRASTAGTCTVYNLAERDHDDDFESKRSGVKQDRRFEVDGINVRRLLRKANRSFDDRQNRTQGWRLNSGNILIGFLHESEDRFEFALLLPPWIVECMRETYLQTILKILPGWVEEYPAPDEWVQDPGATPIP